MGGGWLDQPLSVLAQVRMIDLVNDTYEYKNSEKPDFTKFSPVQNGLIVWLGVGDD